MRGKKEGLPEQETRSSIFRPAGRRSTEKRLSRPPDIKKLGRKRKPEESKTTKKYLKGGDK